MAKGKYEEWLHPEKLVLLEGWARNGLTDEQIAHNIGIRTSTLYEWKKKYVEFAETLKKSKEVADLEVENALFKKAVGYTITEKKVTESDKDGKKVETITKHIPGDVTAQIFWLKNRKSNEWRDKRIVEDKIELESDGFIEALKGQAKTVFEDAGDVIEE